MLQIINKPSYVFEDGHFRFVLIDPKAPQLPRVPERIDFATKERERFLKQFLAPGIHPYYKMQLEPNQRGPFLQIKAQPASYVGRIILTGRVGEVTELHMYLSAQLSKAQKFVAAAFFGQRPVPCKRADVVTGYCNCYRHGCPKCYPKGADDFLEKLGRAKEEVTQSIPNDQFSEDVLKGMWVKVFLACREGSFSIIPPLEDSAKSQPHIRGK